MGGGGGKGGGTTVQSTQIPPEVLARYNAVNARAEQVAQQPFMPYGGEFVAPLTQQQQTGIQNVMNTQGMTEPYYNAATGMTLAGSTGVMPGRLQTGRYMSPYTQAVAAPTYQALSQEQAMQRSGLMNPQTAAAFGGDRSGLVAANLARQQQLGMAQGLAPIYQQGFQQAQGVAQQQQAQDLAARQANLARLMQGAGQLGGIGSAAQQAALQSGQAQIAAGTLPQQTQQALNTALYNQFLQERGYPFQVAQFLANIATGTGALSGSTTTQQQSGGFFGSDERMKEDMEPVGKLFDGQTIYRYKYKDDPEGATHIGVSAQEAAERKKPGLGISDDGYLMVNYRDVTDDAANEGKGLMPESMGGAVLRPGEFARGGYAAGGLSLADLVAAQGQFLAQAGGPGGQKGQPAGLNIPQKMDAPKSLPQTQMLQRPQQPNPIKTAGEAAGTVNALNTMRKGLKEWWNEPSKSQTDQAASQVAKTAGKTASGLDPNKASPIAKEAGLKVEPNTPEGYYVPGGTDARMPESAAQPPLQQIQAQNAAFESGNTGVMPNATDELAEKFGGMDQPLGDATSALADLGSSFGDFGSEAADFGSEAMDFGSMFAKRGGRIHPFASGGLVPRQKAAAGKFVTPGYDAEANPSDIMDTVVESGMQSPSQLLSEQKGLQNKVSGGGGGGGDSGLGTVASIASIGAKVLPFLLKDGGSVNPFAAGGLAVREHHAAGEAVKEDPTAPIKEILRQNAEAEGVPPEYLTTFAGLESRFNPRAENQGAAGLLQIRPDTYKWIGGEGDPFDPVNNARAGAKVVKFNMNDLSKSGYEPTMGNTYLAHFLGPTGAKYALGNPDKPMAETHPGWAKVVEQNSKIDGIQNWTGNDAINWANAKVQGKTYEPPRGALENVGLGIKSAYRKAADTGEAGLGKASSFLENITPGMPSSPENFFVPALSFLGGMLSSPQPRLAGAIGTGLLAGVEGYTELRKQQQVDAKNIIDNIKDTYVMRPDPNKEGSYIFVNTKLGNVLSPDEMQLEVATRALIQGVDPRLMGISPAVIAKAKARLSGRTVEELPPAKAAETELTIKPPPTTPETVTPPAGTTTTADARTMRNQPYPPATPEIPDWMKQDLDKEDLLYMEPGQLYQYVQATPERKAKYNLTNENDPQFIDAEIRKQKTRRDTATDAASIQAAQDEMNRLEARKKTALDNAIKMQLDENQQYRAGVTKDVIDFRTQMEKTAKGNAQKYVQAQDLANRLAQVDARDPTARLKVFKDWADYFGIVPADRVELANIDAMQKIVNDWVAQGVTDQRLTRAPATTIGLESKMVPGPDIQGAAGKELLAKYLAEMDVNNDMQREYRQGRDKKTGRAYYGSDPSLFVARYYDREDVQEKLKKRTAYHMQNLPNPKDTSREQINAWYKQYGQYGYDPTKTPEFGAAKEPATSGTSGNVPFRVVQ
jgi:hypothetical protein